MTEKRSPLVGPFNIISPYTETENLYPFFRANQQKASIKFYLRNQYDFYVNRCDWELYRIVRNVWDLTSSHQTKDDEMESMKLGNSRRQQKSC